MAQNPSNWPVFNNSDNSGTPIADGGDDGDVGKEDRKRRVLAFLVDSGAAFGQVALYRNLRYNGASFSESTLKNYLAELRSEGLIERIDAERFEEGALEPSEEEPGYWVATSEGAERISEYRENHADQFEMGHS